MVMYVELPTPKKSTAATSVANPMMSPAVNPMANPTETKPIVREATPKPPASPRVRPVDHSLFPPGGPNFAIVLPQRQTSASIRKKERQARNYIVVELSSKERGSYGARMRAMFGDHVDWSKVLADKAKPSSRELNSGLCIVLKFAEILLAAHITPICAITGLVAPYRDPRTGIPYANAYAYKTLTRLLQHEFVWSQEKKCYVGDEGKNAAKGVPWNWVAAATGQS
ncbi:hypothetical protein FRC12_018111 [Ceratobasidium sp. 428]|nr:hypothetical protein FRC12_018111 [Ceratobasidium sp. 428]